MATRFRVYRRLIIANVDTIRNVVKATIALHNFFLLLNTVKMRTIIVLETFLIKTEQGKELYRDSGGRRLDKQPAYQGSKGMLEDLIILQNLLNKFEMNIKVISIQLKVL